MVVVVRLLLLLLLGSIPSLKGGRPVGGRTTARAPRPLSSQRWVRACRLRDWDTWRGAPKEDTSRQRLDACRHDRTDSPATGIAGSRTLMFGCRVQFLIRDETGGRCKPASPTSVCHFPVRARLDGRRAAPSPTILQQSQLRQVRRTVTSTSANAGGGVITRSGGRCSACDVM